MSEVVYKTGDQVTAAEMMALPEEVGSGPHRTLGRNERVLNGSLFVATARLNGQLIGLIRLVGDRAGSSSSPRLSSPKSDGSPGAPGLREAHDNVGAAVRGLMATNILSRGPSGVRSPTDSL